MRTTGFILILKSIDWSVECIDKIRESRFCRPHQKCPPYPSLIVCDRPPRSHGSWPMWPPARRLAHWPAPPRRWRCCRSSPGEVRGAVRPAAQTCEDTPQRTRRLRSVGPRMVAFQRSGTLHCHERKCYAHLTDLSLEAVAHVVITIRLSRRTWTSSTS